MDAVSSIENPLDFGFTHDDNDEGTGKEDSQVLEFTDESWWARKNSNLQPMDYESNGPFLGP